MKQRGSEMQHWKNLNLMEVMTAIDLLHVTLKKDRCIKICHTYHRSSTQSFTAMAGCISEWRERERDGLQLC